MCELLTRMERATAHFLPRPLGPWGPGEGSKGQISLNFNYKVNCKYFLLPNFVCVLTNETGSDGILIPAPGSCPMGGTLGHCGAKGVNLFLNMVMWHIKLTGMMRMQVQFTHKVQNGDLGVRSKGQISFNYSYKVNFKDFLYETLCVFSQIKDRKHIERIFILLG